jgi:hypothetical protein
VRGTLINEASSTFMLPSDEWSLVKRSPAVNFCCTFFMTDWPNLTHLEDNRVLSYKYNDWIETGLGANAWCA